MNKKTIRKLKIRAVADRVCVAVGVLMVLAFAANALSPFALGAVYPLEFKHLYLVIAASSVVLMFVVWNRNAPYLALLAAIMYVPLVQNGTAYPIYHLAAVAAVGAVWRMIWYTRWPSDATAGTPVPAWKKGEVKPAAAATTAASSTLPVSMADHIAQSGFFDDVDPMNQAFSGDPATDSLSYPGDDF